MKDILYGIFHDMYIALLRACGIKSNHFLYILKKGVKDHYFYVDFSCERYIQNHFEYYCRAGLKVACVPKEQGTIKIQGKEYEELVRNLDRESKQLVERMIYSIFLSGMQYTLHHVGVIVDRSDKYTMRQKENKKEASISYFKKTFGKLPYNYYEASVFYYWSGLRYMQKEIDFDLKQRDVIDCGAFIGDSVLVFHKILRNVRKIYAIEPEKNNYRYLEQTIHTHNLEENVIPLKVGVGKEKTTSVIHFQGSASYTDVSHTDGGEPIELTTIDALVEKYGIIPGLIKWDIEGYEYESILGAKHTIQTYKPILLISIYHTGKDFFEIKPLIESWNLGYRFTIVDCNPLHLIHETVLVCY